MKAFKTTPDFLLACKIRDVKFGKNVKVIEPVNMFECQVGDNCLVGAFTEIQKNVIIGDGTRIQSHCFICENVTIGNNCFFAHGVMFADDMFSNGSPAFNDKTNWRKISIGNNVCLGTHATIMANICDNVVIGAGAVVTKDITKPGVYAGVPAKYLRPFTAEQITAAAPATSDKKSV